MAQQFERLKLVNAVDHCGEEWDKKFEYDLSGCPFILNGQLPEVEFQKVVKGVDNFIVKDSNPLVDRIKEADVFLPGVLEFGLPHILAGYIVQEWTTRSLIDDADAVFDNVLFSKSEQDDDFQTAASSVEGSRTPLNSVESNQQTEKSGIEHTTDTGGQTKGQISQVAGQPPSKIPQPVDSSTSRNLRSAAKRQTKQEKKKKREEGSSGTPLSGTTSSVDELKGKSGAVEESAGESVQGDASERNKIVHRCHYRMFIKDVGLPLYEAETPFALLEGLLHGMVGE